ncbi:DUF2752 domain-containing protein [Cellulomonas fimi]|uniref:DUF2752 domain-containing protein n=1 Tax=Cellulomonas fimi TaxID=1708 RepID=A0A7Y0QHS0_CELFI|nr:DUF2752 domain-containing protein [Cellulomonas fimi]NMR20448.1 DUF2752 domain-containing protein [Cellulomonas fimi]
MAAWRAGGGASGPAGAAAVRPWALSWKARDQHRLVTTVGAAGALAASALALLGLPPVDLHGLLHYLGIMDPLCGGTRAAYLTVRGEWARAWGYNPLGPLAVIGAGLALVRAGLGTATGRWLTLTVAWTPRRRRAVVAVVVALLAALTVRQQLMADVLMDGTWARTLALPLV